MMLQFGTVICKPYTGETGKLIATGNVAAWTTYPGKSALIWSCKTRHEWQHVLISYNFAILHNLFVKAWINVKHTSWAEKDFCLFFMPCSMTSVKLQICIQGSWFSLFTQYVFGPFDSICCGKSSKATKLFICFCAYILVWLTAKELPFKTSGVINKLRVNGFLYTKHEHSLAALSFDSFFFLGLTFGPKKSFCCLSISRLPPTAGWLNIARSHTGLQKHPLQWASNLSDNSETVYLVTWWSKTWIFACLNFRNTEYSPNNHICDKEIHSLPLWMKIWTNDWICFHIWQNQDFDLWHSTLRFSNKLNTFPLVLLTGNFGGQLDLKMLFITIFGDVMALTSDLTDTNVPARIAEL